MKPPRSSPRRFYPALVLMTFKTIEDIAPKFPTRGDFLAFAEQIRSGAPAPLNIGAPTESDEMCIGVTLADGRIAGAVTRAAWMRKCEEDAQNLRDRLSEEAACDVLVVGVAGQLGGRV